MDSGVGFRRGTYWWDEKVAGAVNHLKTIMDECLDSRLRRMGQTAIGKAKEAATKSLAAPESTIRIEIKVEEEAADKVQQNQAQGASSIARRL